MLFTTEDLTDIWLEQTYEKYNIPPTEVIRLGTIDIVPDYHVGASVSALPPERDKYGNIIQNMHAVNQGIYVFNSIETANEVFIDSRAIWNRLNRYSFLKMEDINLLTKEAFTGCSPWNDNRVYTCKAVFLQKQYVISANTLVDGELITLEEWEAFVKVIDAKIVAQAGK